MIKSVTLENFFSFSDATTIELNPKVNILVGINGSGKSNFLKAIRFLYESVSGSGCEKVFLKDWDGFNSVANFNESKADKIKLIYEFDRNAINRFVSRKGHRFSGNLIYEITIYKAGTTSYYLEEYLHGSLGENLDDIVLIKMKNGNGFVTATDNGIPDPQHYPQNDNAISFKEQELILRQISDPNRFFHLYTLKLALDSIAVYDYFDTTPESKIRQKSFDGIETRLLTSSENLVQILNRTKNHHTLQYEQIEELLTKVNPHFKDIGYEQLSKNFYLTLREKNWQKQLVLVKFLMVR